MKSQKNKYSKESRVFVLFSFVFLISSMYITIITMQTVRNYFEPYKFSIFVAIISLFIGFTSTNYIKPFLKLNAKQLDDYFAHLLISAGFFGVILYLGNELNSNVFSEKICDNYIVVKKEHIERNGRGSIDEDILYLDFENRIEKVLANYNYWKYVEVGNRINVCNYRSSIGFDFLVMTEEQKY